MRTKRACDYEEGEKKQTTGATLERPSLSDPAKEKGEILNETDLQSPRSRFIVGSRGLICCFVWVIN